MGKIGNFERPDCASDIFLDDIQVRIGVYRELIDKGQQLTEMQVRDFIQARIAEASVLRTTIEKESK